ncbi:hypothetical protein B0T16DRAFT_225368 [Cercophora newfieldiana]|uniref:Uncharacterized protein n=1 Tax=Cercophora newfieldiana TaxID=92897 RepID=A0AA39XXK0_9PEZI|nr:hypothetical protein B0T16DRAFT_225368 [Cercophora newfieldiana]
MSSEWSEPTAMCDVKLLQNLLNLEPVCPLPPWSVEWSHNVKLPQQNLRVVFQQSCIHVAVGRGRPEKPPWLRFAEIGPARRISVGHPTHPIALRGLRNHRSSIQLGLETSSQVCDLAGGSWRCQKKRRARRIEESQL